MTAHRKIRREFIIELFSDVNGKISSKRVMAFLSFFVLVGIVILGIFDKHIDSDLKYIFAGLAGGQTVLSIFEKKHLIETNNTEENGTSQ